MDILFKFGLLDPKFYNLPWSDQNMLTELKILNGVQIIVNIIGIIIVLFFVAYSVRNTFSLSHDLYYEYIKKITPSDSKQSKVDLMFYRLITVAVIMFFVDICLSCFISLGIAPQVNSMVNNQAFTKTVQTSTAATLITGNSDGYDLVFNNEQYHIKNENTNIYYKTVIGDPLPKTKFKLTTYKLKPEFKNLTHVKMYDSFRI